MKKILVYCWGAFSENELIKALQEQKMETVVCRKKINDYHRDMKVAQEIIHLLHSQKAEAIISYNYFPLLSMIADMNQIPYISWIYDCPHYTLLSKTMANNYNYIFCFDAAFTEDLRGRGGKHVYHFPLGVDVEDMESRIGQMKQSDRRSYGCDISFVGGLYNNRENRIRNARFSDRIQGYLDGVIEAQLLIYGENFIGKVLTEEIINDMVQVCELQLGQDYYHSEKDLVIGMINKEVTAREREQALMAIASRHNIHVYTGSHVEKNIEEQPGFIGKGYADNKKEMPVIFRESKINLNITLKSITTGIPQRVLDILACGGFCITNWQPEIEEFFEDGVELVMYSSLADLLDKINYYLSHEEERMKIAEKGKEKVRKYFELKLRIGQMLRIMEEERND